jgi:Na+(H+)/acetate symporter ActP
MVVSVIMPFATVLTGVWSIVGGMEAFTWELLIGGVIVMVAILLAEVGDSLKKEKEKPVCTEQETTMKEE